MAPVEGVHEIQGSLCLNLACLQCHNQEGVAYHRTKQKYSVDMKNVRMKIIQVGSSVKTWYSRFNNEQDLPESH